MPAKRAARRAAPWSFEISPHGIRSPLNFTGSQTPYLTGGIARGEDSRREALARCAIHSHSR